MALGNGNPVTRSSNGFLSSPVGINCFGDYNRLPAEVEHLTFEANCCNEDEFVTLDLTRFHDLKELHVKAGSLKNVKDLKLNGFAKLEMIDIGKDCFSDGDNGTFEVKNCGLLKTIAIGESCFCLYDSLVLERMVPLLHFMSRPAYVVFH